MVRVCIEFLFVEINFGFCCFVIKELKGGRGWIWEFCGIFFVNLNGWLFLLLFKFNCVKKFLLVLILKS